MIRDLLPNLDVVKSIVPAVQAGSINGAVVDLKGASSAVVVASFGAIIGAGNMTFKIQEGDASDASDQADVAAGDQIKGSEWAAVALASTIQRIGYRGSKRYIRGVLTLNSGTSVAGGVNVVRGDLDLRPNL